MKLGANHSSNQRSAHALAGKTMGSLPILNEFDWFAKAPADGNMLLNDQMGCCVVVAADWWVKAYTATVKGNLLPISNNMVLEDYVLNGFLGTYDADTQEWAIKNDPGCDTSVHMLRWQAEPRFDILNDMHPIWWTHVNPLDDTQFRAAMSLTPCLGSFFLPDACVDDIDQWGKAPKTGVGWDPNPDNGHRMLVGKFSGQDKWVNTWGHHPYMHPEFFAKYVVDDGFDCPIPHDITADSLLAQADLSLDLFEVYAQKSVRG